MSAIRTINVLTAAGFMALCLVCERWIYVKLAATELQRADDLHCPVCGGSCEADLDTSAFEVVEIQVFER